MVIDRFNMVDLEGIDLVNSRGLVVPGLHSKLVESITPCRYIMIYNFSFAGITIPPTVVEAELEDTDVLINEYIVVDANDEISIPSFEPILSILSVTSNGLYLPESGVEGFSQVDVEVPPPVLVEKSITENGTYNPADDNADGYSSVTVDVEGAWPAGDISVFNYDNSEPVVTLPNNNQGYLPYNCIAQSNLPSPKITVSNGVIQNITFSRTANLTAVMAIPIQKRRKKYFYIDMYVTGKTSAYNRHTSVLTSSTSVNNIYGSFGGTVYKSLDLTNYTLSKYTYGRGIIGFDLDTIMPNADYFYYGFTQCDSNFTIYRAWLSNTLLENADFVAP